MNIKILSAIVTLIVLSACGSKEETPKEEVTNEINTKEIVSLTAAQAKNAAITFCKLEEKEVSSILKLNGKK